METQKNRSRENDQKKDSLSHSKTRDAQKRTPEALNKRGADERSQGLQEDREAHADKHGASKNIAPKQPRK